MMTKTHYKGRYLSLVERDDWEYATRTNPLAAVLVAWLPDHRLVLVEQYRKPIERMTIELPAGLVGDQRGQADESVLAAAHRELAEETGYTAGKITEIMRCPTSAGMTDEIAVFLAADELEKTGPGGGDDSEDITVHTIEHDRVDVWLGEQYRQGKAIDPKIYTALYWGVPGMKNTG